MLPRSDYTLHRSLNIISLLPFACNQVELLYNICVNRSYSMFDNHSCASTKDMICATRSSCTSNNCLCKSTSMPTRVSFQSRTSQPRFFQHVSKEHLHHDDHHLHDSMIINNNSCVSYNFVIIVIVSTVPVWIRRLQLTSHIRSSIWAKVQMVGWTFYGDGIMIKTGSN